MFGKSRCLDKNVWAPGVKCVHHESRNVPVELTFDKVLQCSVRKRIIQRSIDGQTSQLG